jgi:hypothetical protein
MNRNDATTRRERHEGISDSVAHSLRRRVVAVKRIHQ